MSMGAKVSVKHDLYVDLTLSSEEIKAHFRKSYRPLISKGQKLWKLEEIDSSSPNKKETWIEFKFLHQQAAGRMTRSNETWDLQFNMIERDEAVLIILRDSSVCNAIIGAAFFEFTGDEGLYAVGAYKRDMFDRPIGHVIQDYAISLMKQRGLRYYSLGERAFPSDYPKPTNKEVSISLFKQGFASHIFPRFIFSLAN